MLKTDVLFDGDCLAIIDAKYYDFSRTNQHGRIW